MINPMNDRVQGIKQTTLHGNHYANNVYCKDVVIKYGAGVLYCEGLFYDVDWEDIDPNNLEYSDRCYQGVLCVEDVYIDGEHFQGLNPPEPLETDD